MKPLSPVDALQPKRGVTRRITAELREHIRTGVYRAGDLLPSTRALAEELEVSRGTVTAAYEQLHAEGFLAASQGARTRVAAGIKPEHEHPQPQRTLPPNELSSWAKRVSNLPAPVGRPDDVIVDFRYGDLPGKEFPTLGWKRALDAVARGRPERLRYDIATGLPRLRRALQAYLWRSRGLRCDAEQIIVVNGSQQGIDLAVRMLVDPGNSAVIEDPCYSMARDLLSAAGARTIPVPVDEFGLRTDRLGTISNARLAFVTPSHQFPLGGVLPAERRRALLSWAEQSNAWIVEDDYDGEFRYHTRPAPPLHVLGSERVIYLGTASKSLSPQIRLGWMVAPPSLAGLLARAKGLLDRQSPTLQQEALATLMENGAYDRHIRHVRRRYAERRNALEAALVRNLGDRVHVCGSAAGLHLIASFRDIPMAREAELVQAARSLGVGVYGLAPLYGDGGGDDLLAGLVLGFAAIPVEDIDRGIELLARATASIGHTRPFPSRPS